MLERGGHEAFHGFEGGESGEVEGVGEGVIGRGEIAQARQGLREMNGGDVLRCAKGERGGFAAVRGVEAQVECSEGGDGLDGKGLDAFGGGAEFVGGFWIVGGGGGIAPGPEQGFEPEVVDGDCGGEEGTLGPEFGGVRCARGGGESAGADEEAGAVEKGECGFGESFRADDEIGFRGPFRHRQVGGSLDRVVAGRARQADAGMARRRRGGGPQIRILGLG